MTMVEFLKTEAPDNERGVARLFVEAEPLFRALPWETNAQGGWPYNRQTSLPGNSNRAIGESYTPTPGTVEQRFEPLKIHGTVIPFDMHQLRTGTGNRRALEAEGALEGVARDFVRDMIKGDDSADTRNMRGLQARLTDTNNNLFAPGVGPATIENFGLVKRLAERPTAWIMGSPLANKVMVASHDTSVGGDIGRTKDEMGEEVLRLCGLPIIEVDRDSSGADILGFTEASTTTSAYCVSLGLTMMHGIQTAAPMVEDLGRDPSNGTLINAIIDWDASFILRHARAAVRYSQITNAAIELS
jgi:hypothetical protein